ERENEVEPFPSAFRKERARCPMYEKASSMRSLTKMEGFGVIAAPKIWPEDVWTNLNEPADLAAFETRRRG
ncbi:MAG TPA: hypothetical protein VGP94_11555, partial [Tepidisphaeraceae bacterium]|nr:hypothetical protein [Tepidisphaeraceae bacterium]